MQCIASLCSANYVYNIPSIQKSELVLGNKDTGVVVYKIKSLDKKRLAVGLIDVNDNEKVIEITRNIMLPQRFWPKEEVSENNDSPSSNGPEIY